MAEQESQVELIEYLAVISKRKWLIILPTLFCIILAAVISFLLPEVWEVDALIMPAKFIVETELSVFEEILFVNAEQIAQQINKNAYCRKIATDLDLDIREIPELEAKYPQNTNLVHIFLRDKDTEKAEKVLNSLLIILKMELDEKADIGIKEIETQIKSREMEKVRAEAEMKTFKNMLIIVRQRKKEIEDQITKEIQPNSQYFITLNELLSNRRIEEEYLTMQIENKKKDVLEIEYKIEGLNHRKRRIEHTKLIKEPTTSFTPVSPKKGFIIVITGIFSLMIFFMLAFFLEYVHKQKK